MPSPTHVISLLTIGVLISLNVTLLTFVHLLCPVSPLLEIRGMVLYGKSCTPIKGSANQRKLTFSNFYIIIFTYSSTSTALLFLHCPIYEIHRG